MKVLNPFFTLFFISFLFSCSTSEQTTFQPSDKEPGPGSLVSIERPVPAQIELPDLYKAAIQAGTRSHNGAPGPNYWTNYAYYDIQVSIEPADTLLSGSARIEYINNSPDTLRVIVFELSQNLHAEGNIRKEPVEITGGVQLSKIAVSGTELQPVNRFQPGYAVQGTNLIVIPPSPLLPNDSKEIEIDWSFKVPQAGAGARMGYSQDNLFYLAYWYPHVAVYDDLQGWFADQFTGNAEFYHGFGDYKLNITAPEQWIVMSTGVLENAEEVLTPTVFGFYEKAVDSDNVITIVSEDDFGKVTSTSDTGSLTWTFTAEHVRDVAFSVTKESRWDGTRTPVGDIDGDGQTDYTRIHSFWRSSAPLWKEEAAYAAHSISFLSEYTGIPYPWPHMTSVEGAGIIGGGMEFPMMTIMGSYNGRSAQALYDVTAHELAHMWIPMIVSNNERRRTWMDEGPTTFHEANARWDYKPELFSRLDEFSGYLGFAGNDLESPIMRWSDYHYPGPSYGVASYPKSGSLLIALQGVLGEETFIKAWKTYLKRWAYKHPTPYDMFNTFEDVSGTDLDWCWRSWYFENWTLDHSIKYVSQQNDNLEVLIEDLGDAIMPVLLRLTLVDGSSVNTRIDVENWLDGKRTASVQIPVNSVVTSVTIDPDNYFPDVNRENNSWIKN